jgi:squalene-hopene/tetraprenyl-beta-curcumene cyclase
MWAQQQTIGDDRGAWHWLQFDQEPWEANDSPYYGAALAAMAVGTAPESYGSSPEIQNHLQLLREYLNRRSAAQSTINRVFLLWASTKLPGLLRPEQQKAIVNEVLSKQQADGGWRLASLTWTWNSWSLHGLVNMWIREDGTPMDGKSDGVATGLITLALQEAGVSHDSAQLKHGLSWLMSNQNAAEGFWPASSVNKRRHISSDTGRFMSDAATAYAVLALTENQRAPDPVTSASNR